MIGKHKSYSALEIFLCLLILCIASVDKGLCTDVEVSSHLIDNSLGFKIYIPVLSCYVKYTGYSVVTWYKDGMKVKNGSADPAGHLFEVASLLRDRNFNPSFDNSLELQGYYWCETDAPPADAVTRKFLYQIESVNTYVGFFLATQDSLGDDISVTNDKQVLDKKRNYTEEIQHILLGFMPQPNAFVKELKSTKKGLEVHFFVYDLQLFDARLQRDSRLIQDEHILQDIQDYLHNETETDPELYSHILEWVNFRGIDINKISLKSTLGCYIEKTSNPGKSIKEISWPYTYVEDVAIPEEICMTENSLPVTRICKGSFEKGASWSSVSGVCEKEPNPVTKSLKELLTNIKISGVPDTLKALEEVVKKNPNFGVTDLILIANVLGMSTIASNLDEEDIDRIFTSVDGLLKVEENELSQAKLRFNFTNRILTSINNVIEKANEDHIEMKVSKSSLLVYTKDTEVGDRHVNGASVTLASLNSSLEDRTVEFLINGSGFPFYESTAGFLLPTELVVKRESELIFPCQLNVAFFKDWKLFSNPQLPAKLTSADLLPTPVLSITLPGGPAWNLTNPVRLFFKHDFQGLFHNPVCVYFDPKLEDDGAWATEGCFYEGLLNGYHMCHCHHLSTFSVILTRQKVYKLPIFRSHVSLYVGCGVSMIGLVLVVLLYVISKNWRLTIDQDVLFHLSLSFLCSLIMLLVHEVQSTWEPGCLLISHTFYYYVLVMFCWLFIQSIVYYIRFSKKAETGDIPHFLIKCIVSAWGMPLVVIGIIGISRKYGYYEQKTCWPTLEEASGAAVIPIVIVLLLGMGFDLNAAYSISCRYKKDFLIGHPKYKEAALKFRAALTLFMFIILAWIFGYVALWDQRKEMQILFSIFIIVSSIYVTLFFIFHEMSLSELFQSKNEISEPIAQVQKYDSQSYQAVEE